MKKILSSVLFLALSSSVFAKGPCEAAAKMAAVAFWNIDSSAWEIEKYGNPGRVDTVAEHVGVILKSLNPDENSGSRVVYNVVQRGFNDNIINKAEVSVHSIKEFCELLSIKKLK